MTNSKKALTADVSFDFDNSHLEIGDKVRRFDLPWLKTPGAFLMVKPAIESNEKYNAGMLRMNGQRKRQSGGLAKLTAEEAAQDRSEDEVLYSKYVVVGWGGILNKPGQEVPFSQPACRAFLASLASWVFDRVRVYCLRAENFLDDDEALDPDSTETAEN